MSEIKLNPAQERCAQLALFPDYVLTPGTELCLIPHIQRYTEALADEYEQQILGDLALHDGEFGAGFDAGLRAAISSIQALTREAPDGLER
jgi:hypothetical protein